jgi:hypothetical protein
MPGRISSVSIVTQYNYSPPEITRLHEQALESRRRVVESQLSLAFTLCTIAETEMRYSRPDQAIKLVNKIRHHAETIRIHLDEPNHLPKASIHDLRDQLTKLKTRTEEIQLGIGRRSSKRHLP